MDNIRSTPNIQKHAINIFQELKIKNNVIKKKKLPKDKKLFNIKYNNKTKKTQYRPKKKKCGKKCSKCNKCKKM